MNSKRSEGADDENTHFDLPASALEDHKPGIDYIDAKKEDATQGHHRFPRRDRKDVPQASLAERIRRAPKGG